MTRQRRSSRTIPEHACRRIDEGGVPSYGVLAEIARGGTSTIYLGEHHATGERVAIKALDAFYVGRSDMVHRLLGEYDVAQRVSHPGLLKIRCAEQTAHGIPYVVMEYLDGESLGALIDRSRLSIEAVIGVARQIAGAVAALHASGVMHCDLKPDNVFVLYEGGPGGWPRIKVIDYGVARLVDADLHGADAAEPAMLVGTPAFMAPEQWRGAPTKKSDVYALGCMLYELVTGEPMFSGALPQLMVAHCERTPDRPSQRCPDLDPELERLIIRMLAKEAALRPTMAEVEAGLGAAMPRSVPAVAWAAAAVPPRRHRRDSFGAIPDGFASRLEAVG